MSMHLGTKSTQHYLSKIKKEGKEMVDSVHEKAKGREAGKDFLSKVGSLYSC